MTKKNKENGQKALDYINNKIRELKRYPGYFADRDAQIQLLYKTRARLYLEYGFIEEPSASVMQTVKS